MMITQAYKKKCLSLGDALTTLEALSSAKI